MTRHSLIFDGINSADYGVWISGDNVFASPSRDVEYVSVPGRNGDLIIDNGKWNNIRLTYPAFIPRGYDSQIDEFRRVISKKKGYRKLEDDYHPEEYRLASFSAGISPNNQSAFYRSGRFDLTFNCKPQRFLKSGDDPVVFIPPTVSGNTMQTGYFAKASDTVFRWKVKCPETATMSAQITSYDANGSFYTSYYFNDLHNGMGMSFAAFTADEVYFRFSITATNDLSLDDISAEIGTAHIVNGVHEYFEGTFARTFKILNPTGYASKPLIESMSNRLPFILMRNYVDGEIEEYYDFRTDETSASHFYMDCDLQYLYDDDGNNLTNYLFLTNNHSAAGKGLVFPQFSEEETMLQMYYSTASLAQGISEIKIYPRWWKL